MKSASLRGVSCAMRSTNDPINSFSGPLPNVRRADRVYCPVTLLMSDERADADNRVVDALWELVAE
jgi:hypothetical protein